MGWWWRWMEMVLLRARTCKSKMKLQDTVAPWIVSLKSLEHVRRKSRSRGRMVSERKNLKIKQELKAEVTVRIQPEPRTGPRHGQRGIPSDTTTYRPAALIQLVKCVCVIGSLTVGQTWAGSCTIHCYVLQYIVWQSVVAKKLLDFFIFFIATQAQTLPCQTQSAKGGDWSP